MNESKKQPIKMIPGDELHLTALMAPFSLNLVTGQDRQHLLGYGRAAFEAGQKTTAAGQCLHQIQEPEADIWPCVNLDVDESGKITNAKLYSPGLPAGNHDVYPVRVPYMDEHTEAWRACVDELEKAVPGFMSLGNMNGIECAVAAIRGLSERAKYQELAAAEQAAWHAGLGEGRTQATASVSNAETPQAAPAAVPVADERAAFERVVKETMHDAGEDHIAERLACWPDGAYKDRSTGYAWWAWQSRAALAATPAAAAPVVPPEPAGPIIEKLLALARIVDIAVEDWGESFEDGSMDVKFHSDVVTELESILDHFDGLPEGPDDNVIESGPVKAARILRALLATATGLPAQATEEMVRAVAFELIGITPESPLAEASVKPYLKQAKKLLEVAFNAAPQEQASGVVNE